MSNRTGKKQLSVKSLMSKLGSMAKSTKCCATGTCKNYANPGINAPTINLEFDSINSVGMMIQFGALA